MPTKTSCLSKEYGHNRELRRFMKLRIMTDQFHQCNHTTCSDLNEANSEACEQVNSALRRITNSTTFISPILYIRAITLFLAEMNITANKLK